MIVDKETNSQLLWSEIEETDAETINGGHHRSRSGSRSIASFIQNNIFVFQTNIVTIIGNIGGDLIVNVVNASGIDLGGNRRGRNGR